jgi:hypothetical protein
VSAPRFLTRLSSALRSVRLARLFIVLLVAGVAALASDWLRDERVLFPAPLPKFNQVPAAP